MEFHVCGIESSQSSCLLQLPTLGKDSENEILLDESLFPFGKWETLRTKIPNWNTEIHQAQIRDVPPP